VETLRVALAERSYPIHIGSGLLDAAELLAPHVRGRQAAVLTSQVIAPHYLARAKATLERAGARPIEVVVQDGEAAKDWPTLQSVFDAFLAARLGRDGIVVALGGGVVGDLAGFAAAVYQRGVPYIQVPTTLLAQVDSSVGGKTAINHPRGKNMIGAFHQPLAVVADVALLGTLPERELRAGLAEVIKHGAALDLAFFEWLEQSMEKLLARDEAALVHAVRRCCELKAAVVSADEREAGARALLNLGHTFGHAIEAGAGYGAWLHGEAVAAGMVMAAELSAREGLLAPREVERVRRLIARAQLPVAGPKLPPERLVELMAVDKKNVRGETRFVLLERLGHAVVKAGVPAERVREAIVAAR